MTPAEIITDPIEFNRWWQTRLPANQDRAIIRTAETAGLLTRGQSMICLTAKGKTLRRRAFIGKLSPRLRRALREIERAKANEVEEASPR